MSTITKEWLQQKIADMEATRDEIPFGLDEDDSNTLAALLIALASLEVEPVAWIVHARTGDQLTTDGGYVANAEGILGLHSTPLYTAPQAPVSVPDEHYQNLSVLYHAQEKRLFKIAQRIKGPSFDKYAYSPSQAIDALESAIFGEREDDCRAAMLQGAEPVPTAYKLPEGWVAVPVEPTEDMIVNGFESEPDESFSDEKEWEEYEAMSGCQQAAHRAKLCWAAMIAAAPQQEAE